MGGCRGGAVPGAGEPGRAPGPATGLELADLAPGGRVAGFTAGDGRPVAGRLAGRADTGAGRVLSGSATTLL
jgi:hypothetical protein